MWCSAIVAPIARTTLSRDVREFLDELAELIADAILEEEISIEDESPVTTEDSPC